MKISQLVGELLAVMSEHGNLDVKFDGSFGYESANVVYVPKDDRGEDADHAIIS